MIRRGSGSDRSGYGTSKTRSGRVIDRTIAAARNFMECAEGQTAFRQMLVDRLDTQWRRGLSAAASPFETLNALPEPFDDRKGRGRTHVRLATRGQNDMFLFCSFRAVDSIGVFVT
jgi:hypothetical protein